MKRIPVRFSTRLIAGSAIRLMLFVICLLLTPVLCVSLLAGKDMIGLTIAVLAIYVPSALVFLYCYSRLGIFTDGENIIEKNLLSGSSIKITNIDRISLDMINGGRYSSVVIQLYDKNFGLNTAVALENASFFKILTYKPEGVLSLKTIQYQLRKKNAWNFAKALIGIIRTSGNRSAKVILPEEPTDKGLSSLYERQSYRFWKGFEEDPKL